MAMSLIMLIMLHLLDTLGKRINSIAYLSKIIDRICTDKGLRQSGHYADKGGEDQFFVILCGFFVILPKITKIKKIRGRTFCADKGAKR